jgi:hypothetical protein
MDLVPLFLRRHDVLYDFWLGEAWRTVPDDVMRRRPHPHLNSIAWNLWHLTRGQDAGLNRFVADRAQVLDDGGWMERMNVPWRHHGGGMTLAEVDDLSRRIDLPALWGYSDAVRVSTREIVSGFDPGFLDAALDAERLRVILVDEGLAHSHATELLETYARWTRGDCVLNLGLTHPFQHLGQMNVLATLLGVEFG